MRSYELQRASHWRTVRRWLHAQYQHCLRREGDARAHVIHQNWTGTLTWAMDQWKCQEDLQEHILGSFQEMVSIVATFPRVPGWENNVQAIEESMMSPIRALINLYNNGMHPDRVLDPYVIPHPDLYEYARTWGFEAVAYNREKRTQRVLKKLPLSDDTLRHLLTFL